VAKIGKKFKRLLSNFGHQVASLELVQIKFCTLPHAFLQFWFPIFLYIRFVFHFNEQQSDLLKGSLLVTSVKSANSLIGRYGVTSGPIDLNLFSTCQVTLFCISFNVGHHMVPLALPHCIGLPDGHHQLVLSCYPHQPESHQLSANSLAGR